MTRVYAHLIAALLVAGILPATSQAIPPREKILDAPAPEYPYEARSQHWTGKGIVLLEVDPKTGYVTAARMLKSTGHAILDHAAVSAFVHWRFKPGTRKQVKIPISYTM